MVFDYHQDADVVEAMPLAKLFSYLKIASDLNKERAR